MRQISVRTGNLLDLKDTISQLHNFTGFIKLNNSMLFYKDSKLINSTHDGFSADLKFILRKLPDKFIIEIYECTDEELDALIGTTSNNINNNINNINNIDAHDFRNNTTNNDSLTNNVSSNNANNSVPNVEDILLTNYGDLQKYLGKGIYVVDLKPKRYKTDEGIILFKNKEELGAVYIYNNSKNNNGKILEGKRAMSKIKTIFAVSEVKANIKKISANSLNRFLETYPNSLLKTFVLFDDLIKKIKEKEFKLIKNDSLANILTKTPSLIEIDDGMCSMYIVSNEKKPVYAFFEEYDGDKAYRHIKNFCIFNDIEFKIYPLNENEFKLFKEFRENKIKAI